MKQKVWSRRIILPNNLFVRMCYGEKAVLAHSRIEGDLFVERMMTVTTTCKLQKHNRYDYINSAVDAHLRNKPVPSILYQEELTVPDKIAA